MEIEVEFHRVEESDMPLEQQQAIARVRQVLTDGKGDE